MNEAYVEVYAMATYARDVGDPSGGEETTLAHVNWDENGFTGVDWFTKEYTVYDVITGDPITGKGPLYGYEVEDILEIISAQGGNLNEQFNKWSTTTIENRSGWIQYVESQNSGCVA